MAEFFDMGGYAAFIWPVYGLAALVMVVLLISAIHRARRTEQELAAARSAMRGRD